jgi:hypothetical protein
MSDKRLIKECIRVAREAGGIDVEVMTVSWDGPATPVVEWERARTLPADADQELIDRSIADVLSDQKYFRICSECNKRQVVGYMMDEYCQSCGSQNHGVVF